MTVKLRDGEAVYGWIEYFDDRMIRLTREGKPNLFIYKNQIRTISESVRNIEARRRDRNRSTGAKQPALLPAGIPELAGSASESTPVSSVLEVSAPAIRSVLSSENNEDSHGHNGTAMDGTAMRTSYRNGQSGS
ncbi:hypothetical protein ACPOL_5900 [Acidisarcina polymorpha]|uniref:Uncharacterized protein n=1 Tax=Acidisarcina polymorpha TaxID=2211140 RepID=A0A2Z5G8Y0_9BACT|nr:RNA chaperone Hfq [Acidisarcina polymorpha]AXC15144.1 hypothetical protein ACPOL_5900 [Acidisarcina polymorpha]